MYKLCKNLDGTIANCVILNGITAIPFVPDNTDYHAYLAWLAKNNTPLPADES